MPSLWKTLWLVVIVGALLALAGCGGDGGGDGQKLAVDKHITCMFINSSAQKLWFKSGEYPSLNQPVPGGGGSSTNPGFELMIPGDSDQAVWTFSAVDSTGTSVASGAYTWNVADGRNSTKLQVSYLGVGGQLSFQSLP